MRSSSAISAIASRTFVPQAGIDSGAFGSRDHDLRFFEQDAERRASVGDHPPAEQVEPLDAGRALVDAVELLIAQPRFGQVLARVAVAAVDLHRERVGLEAPLGGEGLGDRREQIEQSEARRRELVVDGASREVRVCHAAKVTRESPPSTIAFCRSSMRRTSACSMIGTCGFLGSRDAIGRPCGRVRAYSSDSWYATDAVATPFRPTMMRASFIIWNM